MEKLHVEKSALVGLLLALVLQAPSWAAAQMTFERIVVFGDSLSDPGNLFVVENLENTPPYEALDPLLIPDRPYAKGGHHFSNGATWVEQFARPLGLAGNTKPAFRQTGGEATNFAVAGARAYDDGINANFSIQVDSFNNAFGGIAPPNALYVVEFGGNDIRDALTVYASGGDGSAIITEALYSIGNNMGRLYEMGARKFLVWNAPDLGLTPAVRMLGAVAFAESITNAFNTGLDAVLGSMAALPGIELVKFNLYQKINDMVADPAAYGLSVVDTACIMPGIPPYECQSPDEFLFWDGIHPTKTVHGIISQEVATLLAH